MSVLDEGEMVKSTVEVAAMITNMPLAHEHRPSASPGANARWPRHNTRRKREEERSCKAKGVKVSGFMVAKLVHHRSEANASLPSHIPRPYPPRLFCC